MTSALVVAAITRRVFAEGGFAAVLKKGAEEAGAIFVLVRAGHDGQALYGPAPQTSYEEDRPHDRRFRRLVEIETSFDEAIELRIEKERRFDPDLWLVELEGGPPIDDLVIVEAEDADGSAS
nr:DUF1491 family protein [Notoacmeibacter sp. MSK16QG-6]